MLVNRRDAARQDRDEVRARIEEAVDRVAGRRPFGKVTVWPSGPRTVDDKRIPTLLVLDPDHAWDRSGDLDAETPARAYMRAILTNAVTPRQYKNTLVFVLPTAAGVRKMEDAAVELMALEAIDRQYGTGGLSESQVDDLTEKLGQAEQALPATVWGAYTLIAAPSGTTDGKPRLWMRQELGIRGYRPGEHSLARRVWDRLMEEERLDPRLVALAVAALVRDGRPDQRGPALGPLLPLPLPADPDRSLLFED